MRMSNTSRKRVKTLTSLAHRQQSYCQPVGNFEASLHAFQAIAMAIAVKLRITPEKEAEDWYRRTTYHEAKAPLSITDLLQACRISAKVSDEGDLTGPGIASLQDGNLRCLSFPIDYSLIRWTLCFIPGSSCDDVICTSDLGYSFAAAERPLDAESYDLVKGSKTGQIAILPSIDGVWKSISIAEPVVYLERRLKGQLADRYKAIIGSRYYLFPGHSGS